MPSTAADHAHSRTPSPGLVNLADPEVRQVAREALAAGYLPEIIAAEIGVTVDGLAQALRRVRRRSR